MKDVGFIGLVYGLTFGGIIVLVVRTMIVGSRLAKRIPDEDKPWI
jgi:hypothetical protein